MRASLAGYLSALVVAVACWGPVRAQPPDARGLKIAFVKVPAGSFDMGWEKGCVDERPVHRVTLSEFWIGKYELTQAQYLAFCQATKHKPPRYRFGDNYPVVSVTHADAEEFCKWAGYRLPTEAEWEYAARGPENRLYPWGDEWDPAKAVGIPPEDVKDNMPHTKPLPVGSRPSGASWCGALDLAGNVWEWVAGLYAPYPEGPVTDPPPVTTGVDTWWVARGGSCRCKGVHLRSTLRARRDAAYPSWDTIGFRVAWSERDAE